MVRLPVVVIVCLLVVASCAAPQPRRVVLIFAVDGLRPDSINAQDSPTIERLRAQGVEYTNSHSVFPTLTRVNAASLATGAYPSLHGIVSNNLFHPAVNSTSTFDTGNYRNLLKVEEADGRAATLETLSEVLQRNGRRLVAIGSGSTGSAYLLNPAARRGVGALIHGHFDRSLVAYPPAVNDVLLKRFGAPEPNADDLAVMLWNNRVLSEYVLPEMRPDVLVNWMGPLDSAQHEFGVRSPEALHALGEIDRSIDLTLRSVQGLGLSETTTVFIVSDHGFAKRGTVVDLSAELVKAGLKTDSASPDVVIDNQGQMAALYVADHDSARIRQLVAFLQRQHWASVIFTRGGSDGRGSVLGTFSLDLIQGAHATRAADIVVAGAWNSMSNSFGVQGTNALLLIPANTNNVRMDASGHGGMSPWVIRNTLIASGAGVKKDLGKIQTPASLADVGVTVLSIFGIEAPADRGRGRPLRESLEGGPIPPVPTQRMIAVEAGDYRASIQVSSVAAHDYVDQGTRGR